MLSGEENPLLWAAVSQADQEAVNLLCCKSTLLAHVQLGVRQDTQICFCQAASKTPRIPGEWVCVL